MTRNSRATDSGHNCFLFNIFFLSLMFRVSLNGSAFFSPLAVDVIAVLCPFFPQTVCQF
jgi:hypothetical protein